MIIQQLKRARAVGVPVVAIATPDQPALVTTIQAGLNGSTPLVRWDLIQGFQALNDKGQDVALTGEEYQNPVEALKAALHFEQGSVLLMVNAHRYLDETPVMQCVMNLRDQYKATGRTLVLLGPDFRLPVELAQDTLILDEELPSPDAIRAIVGDLLSGGGIETTPEILERSTDALRGLAAFPVEQATALSVDLKAKVVDLGELWKRKGRMIEQTKGLSMESPSASFGSIGGSDQWKKFAGRLFAGPSRPRVVVLIDEIEKAMAGAREDGPGDSSGVAQDQLGVMLSEMEDRHYGGAIFVGPPGSGKTMAARATAASFDVPLVRLDLGAMKGSLVGQSEQNIRAAMRTILAIAGEGGAFIVGTCNELRSLPAALRRRFHYGVWFYDLPDEQERRAIGLIHGGSAGESFFSKLDGWSGANIRDCAELAQAMATDFDEASAFVVPAATQDPAGLDRLRSMASGRFLSAARPGPYKAPSALIETAKPTIRKLGEVYAATMPETPSEEEKAGGN